MDRWMADHFAELADRHLDELTLPGSHDSAAFALAAPGASGPLSPTPRGRLLWLLGCCAAPCVAPWTLTQAHPIASQLTEAGCRFLDIRVAWDASRATFMTSHTFACAPLADVLSDVVAFLRGHGHEREAVVLCLRPDWPHRQPLGDPNRTADLIQQIEAAAGELLYPPPWQAAVGAASGAGTEVEAEAEAADPRPPGLAAGAPLPPPRLPTLGAMVASGRRLLAFVEGMPPPPLASPPPPGDASAGRRGVEPAAGAGAGGPGSLCAGERSDAVALAGELEAAHLPALLAEGLAGVGAVCLDYPSPEAARAVVQLNLARAAS
ncbi:hypothetical protein GPECTOR_233g539 [Gonium pectorale]|uniref:Phosphatidylinositol-specific phospholipase C X domain-containing protein n=1 Tax=Gonium pectorale TaxID=33097 RepID=A0A150FWI6_GONPE|nr:hypothetical protein GPECTOR_233g539 [Gonium pectorale]|eukprot:KXZ41966.1 hypothetical protein GPECTOR_233g539 [Gonium pectorale]